MLAINTFIARKADLFITFTCNPGWKEITDNLNSDFACYRPDLEARVFKNKLDQFINDIKKHYFGVVVALFYVIEYQKRGLISAFFLTKYNKTLKQ
jgi:hypothetical protein